MKTFIREEQEVNYLNSLEFLQLYLEAILKNSLFLTDIDFLADYSKMMIGLNDIIDPNIKNNPLKQQFINIEDDSLVINYYQNNTITLIANAFFKNIYFIEEGNETIIKSYKLKNNKVVKKVIKTKQPLNNLTTITIQNIVVNDEIKKLKI
ncbi:MAG: hypothetical protein RSB71_00940 [Bacilli bacterium]